ncbi:hypothetical protein [Pseudobutyrivibrio sp.]
MKKTALYTIVGSIQLLYLVLGLICYYAIDVPLWVIVAIIVVSDIPSFKTYVKDASLVGHNFLTLFIASYTIFVLTAFLPVSAIVFFIILAIQLVITAVMIVEPMYIRGL